MTIHPDQIAAAEAVLKPFIQDPAVSVAGLFLQAFNAFHDAAPAKKKRAETFKDEPEGFAEFYTAFPRREARRDAAKAYLAALTRATQDLILAGAKRYTEATKGTEPQYIKLPGTWLRADCWRDDRKLTLVAGSGAVFEDCSEEGWLGRLRMFFGIDGASLWTWRAAWSPDPFSPGTKVPESAKTRFKAENPRLDLKALYASYQVRKTG